MHCACFTLHSLNRIRLPGLGGMLACVLLVGPSQAEDVPWEVDPYDVRIWLIDDGAPELTARREDLMASVQRRLQLRCGAGWKTLAALPGPETVRAVQRDQERIGLSQLEEYDAESTKADKIYLVRLSRDAHNIHVRVREMDCSTRLGGDIVRRVVSREDLLSASIADAILDAFSPIAQIGRVEERVVDKRKQKTAPLKLKAGLLDPSGGTPISVPVGSQMQVVLRRNDRHGNPIPDGIEVVPWTSLQAESQANGIVNCVIWSGLNNPIRARGSRRVDRLAMLVKPRKSHTRIEFQSRGDANQKLSGYDVYYQLPGGSTKEFLARSDWRGQILIERDPDHPLKILYVKNGRRVLARLPVVAGLQDSLVAQMTDDALRLEAEGFVRGLQEQLIDVVARRKILALRITRRVEEKKIEEARVLLDEMRGLPTRADLERQLREREHSYQTRDKSQQDRINKLFRDTRVILQKQLDSREIDELRSKIDQA